MAEYLKVCLLLHVDARAADNEGRGVEHAARLEYAIDLAQGLQ
jgi:hypothetical protein